MTAEQYLAGLCFLALLLTPRERSQGISRIRWTSERLTEKGPAGKTQSPARARRVRGAVESTASHPVAPFSVSRWTRKVGAVELSGGSRADGSFSAITPPLGDAAAAPLGFSAAASTPKDTA